MKTKCDACGHEWDVAGFETEHVERDVERTFFRCPGCGKEYLVYYTNQRIRRLMGRQAKSMADPTMGKNSVRWQYHLQCKEKIKALCDELKEKYTEPT